MTSRMIVRPGAPFFFFALTWLAIFLSFCRSKMTKIRPSKSLLVLLACLICLVFLKKRDTHRNFKVRQAILKNDENRLKEQEMKWPTDGGNEYQNRKNRLKLLCEKSDMVFDDFSRFPEFYNDLGLRDPWNKKANKSLFNLVMLSKKKLIYCPLPVSASTYWYNTMLKSFDKKRKPLWRFWRVKQYSSAQKIPRVTVKNYKQKLPKYFKFAFIRHPFTRIAALYRDYFYEGKTNKVQNRTQTYWRKQLGDLARVGPFSFREFVQYLIATDVNKMEIDWKPFWSVCAPCVVKYDFIGKVETLGEDQKQLLLEPKFKFKEKELPVNEPKKWDWVSTDFLLPTFYATVPKEEIIALYKKYKLDFEMGGYSIDIF